MAWTSKMSLALRVAWSFMVISYLTLHSNRVYPFLVMLRVRGYVAGGVRPPSHRRLTYDQARNQQLLLKTLDAIEEQREKAQLRVATYQQKIAKYFDSRVRKKKFIVGDLVLWCVFLSTRDPAAGQPGPNWEGPYQIKEVLDPRTYNLARLNGDLVPRYWNSEHLRKNYQ